MPSPLPAPFSSRASRGSLAVLGVLGAACLFGALAACGGGTFEDAGDDPSDGEVPAPARDAGQTDAGRDDAGRDDAGSRDAGDDGAAALDAGECDGVTEGAPCGDPSSSDCNGADTCQQGVCIPNVVDDGEACGDPTATDCTAADTCLAGVCAPNHTAAGTACGTANPTQCREGDTCTENGTCEPNLVADGTVCYDCPQGGGLCSSCTTGACTNGPQCTPTPTPSGELDTPIVNNNGQDGNMFDITATNTVVITGFEGNIANVPNATTEYHVFYKRGSHVGFENNSAAWTALAGPLPLVPNTPNALTEVLTGLSVVVPAGETVAFYLTNTSAISNNNRYHTGTGTGAVLVADANLTVKEGTGGAYPFGTFFNARPWEGRIRYRTALGSGAVGAVASDGVMFDLAASSALSLRQLDVHLSEGAHDLSVFFRRGTHVGAETTPASWHLLGSAAGLLATASALTTVPFAAAAQLEAGETGAFYVTTGPATNGVLSSAGTVVGTPSATNPQATFHEGVAVSGTFGAVGAVSHAEAAIDYALCAP